MSNYLALNLGAELAEDFSIVFESGTAPLLRRSICADIRQEGKVAEVGVRWMDKAKSLGASSSAALLCR